MRKLSDMEVAWIRENYRPYTPGANICDFAAKFGVSRSTMWNVVAGVSHAGGPKSDLGRRLRLEHARRMVEKYRGVGVGSRKAKVDL